MSEQSDKEKRERVNRAHDVNDLVEQLKRKSGIDERQRWLSSVSLGVWFPP
jgi:hypothetical protein